jgi:hypothetical protein
MDKADKVQRFLEDNDWCTLPYSGRFMYGKKCLATIVDEAQLQALGRFISETSGLVDNMGFDYVVYWPEIPHE